MLGWISNPYARSVFYQAIIVFCVISLTYWIIGNTVDNLDRASIASGFGFLTGRAGFEISQSLVHYTIDSTYARAFYVGFINTSLVAFCSIIIASVIGFLVGVGRLSHNWLVSKLCMVYIEIFRNIPPLLVICFWYYGVLSILPMPRSSLDLGIAGFLNNRGFFIPRMIWEGQCFWTLAGVFVGLFLTVWIWRWAYARQMKTGKQFPRFWISLALLIGLPVLGFMFDGVAVSFEYPRLGAFNLSGGVQIIPEFIALCLALSLYTAAFIAEIVRGGILGISHGQTEAALALGLGYLRTLRLVVIPQALRFIIPSLTSQYLNLAKNSSLGIVIGYPDLMAVGGTILNQSGQSVEIVAIWMMVYLSLSLATSAFMNWFNSRMKLVGR